MLNLEHNLSSRRERFFESELRTSLSHERRQAQRGSAVTTLTRLTSPSRPRGTSATYCPTRIVYDAQTTSGGSGGPLFNNEGRAKGISFAMESESTTMIIEDGFDLANLAAYEAQTAPGWNF